jgi:hypothetical protein
VPIAFLANRVAADYNTSFEYSSRLYGDMEHDIAFDPGLLQRA